MTTAFSTISAQVLIATFQISQQVLFEVVTIMNLIFFFNYPKYLSPHLPWQQQYICIKCYASDNESPCSNEDQSRQSNAHCDQQLFSKKICPRCVFCHPPPTLLETRDPCRMRRVLCRKSYSFADVQNISPHLRIKCLIVWL